MKITKEKSRERDVFIMNLFLADPALSIPKANLKLKAQFGSQRNWQTLYKLRRAARTMLEDQRKQAARPLQSAGRNPPAPAVVIPVRSDAHGLALREAVASLVESGVAALKVAFETKTYLVVER